MPLSPVLESSRGHVTSGGDDVEMGNGEESDAVKQACNDQDFFNDILVCCLFVGIA